MSNTSQSIKNLFSQNGVLSKEQEAAKLEAYKKVVNDELKHWFIDSKSERQSEIVKGWFGKEIKKYVKKNGKYKFKTNTEEPEISYEYLNPITESWEKMGILSQDQFKEVVKKHLLTSTGINLDEYHEKHLISLIDTYFYSTMQSFGINGFTRQRPTPLMKYVGKNKEGKNIYEKLSLHNINQKVYKGTIHGHNYGATVSRRYDNTPLSNGEIPTRIGNRNYAVTVKGGRKKSYRRKTRRNYSAFRVKNSK